MPAKRNGPANDRQPARFWLGQTMVLFVFALGAINACGGSASETPPPLEPDPHALPRLRQPAKESTAPPGERDEPLPLREDVPPTWGSGQKRAPIQREAPRFVDGG
jgi:hypothetical protein